MVERRHPERHRVSRSVPVRRGELPGALAHPPLSGDDRRGGGDGPPARRHAPPPRHRGRRRRRVPTAELGRGGRLPLWPAPARGRRGPHRAHLRVQGGRPHFAAEPSPRPDHRRPLRPPGLPLQPRGHGAVAARPRAGGRRVHRRAGRACARPHRAVLVRGDFRRRPTRSGRGRGPRQPGAHRLHLGHHRGAQGGHPHPSQLSGRSAHLGHVRRRREDPTTGGEADRLPHRVAGRSCHGARGGAGARCSPRGRST